MVQASPLSNLVVVCSFSVGIFVIGNKFIGQTKVDFYCTITPDQWHVMSPDMNPNRARIVWDFIGRKVKQRDPQCQNIAELTNAILDE